jgi:hypothetical protein
MTRVITILAAALAFATPAQARRLPTLSIHEARSFIDRVDYEFANTHPALERWTIGGCVRLTRLSVGCREVDYWSFGGSSTFRATVYVTPKNRLRLRERLLEEEPPSPPSNEPAPSTPSEPASPYEPTYPVICADGTISPSGGHQGACSHHGGVA